jgi:hypothetical protein
MGIAATMQSLLRLHPLLTQVELLEQRAPVAQSVLRVQALVQAVVPQTKKPHEAVEVTAQVPTPSQVAAAVEMFVGLSHEASRHGVATVG